MAPLTLIDAKQETIVVCWLGAWILAHTPSAYMVTTSLQIAHEDGGLLSTWDGTTHAIHADSAALVAYVVAWARGTL